MSPMSTSDDALKEALHTIGYAEGHKAVGDRLLHHLNALVPDIAQSIRTAEIEEVQEKVKKIIEQVPAGRQRRHVLHKVRRLLNRDKSEIDKEHEAKSRKIEHLRGGIDAAEKIETWLTGTAKLQKPVGTMIHSFQQALIDGQIFDFPSKDCAIPEGDTAAWAEMASSASVFMVQHNWADAFKNAKDYIGGETRLPDEVCAFEFRINDRHVIAFAADADGALYLQHAVQVRKGWLVLPVSNPAMPDDFDILVKYTSEQVKAIAVALDAEVAITNVVRAPHKLNHARERAGKLPIHSYHIVNLAHRTRATPLAATNHEPAYHVRLHFRRGHWRHYEDHKTWIKWMLVGNPDLGFVDKEYRL